MKNKILPYFNMLSKPSTETQSTAIFILVFSTIFAVIFYFLNLKFLLPLFIFIILVSAFVSLWKFKFEKYYGDFFMSSIAYSSDDVLLDDSNKLIKGRTIVCELHLIGSVFKMAKLHKQGKEGKLKIIIETLKAIEKLRENFNSKRYEKIDYITIRTDMKSRFIKLFKETKQQPIFSFCNKAMKLNFSFVLSLIFGKKMTSHFYKNYKLYYITRDEFLSDDFTENLNNQLESAENALSEISGSEKIHV